MKLTNAQIVALQDVFVFFDGWVENGVRVIPSVPFIPVGYALGRNKALLKEPLESYYAARKKIVGEDGIPDGDPRQPKAKEDIKALNETEIDVAVHQFPAAGIGACVPSITPSIAQALLPLLLG